MQNHRDCDEARSEHHPRDPVHYQGADRERIDPHRPDDDDEVSDQRSQVEAGQRAGTPLPEADQGHRHCHRDEYRDTIGDAQLLTECLQRRPESAEVAKKVHRIRNPAERLLSLGMVNQDPDAPGQDCQHDDQPGGDRGPSAARRLRASNVTASAAASSSSAPAVPSFFRPTAPASSSAATARSLRRHDWSHTPSASVARQR